MKTIIEQGTELFDKYGKLAHMVAEGGDADTVSKTMRLVIDDLFRSVVEAISPTDPDQLLAALSQISDIWSMFCRAYYNEYPKDPDVFTEDLIELSLQKLIAEHKDNKEEQ